MITHGIGKASIASVLRHGAALAVVPLIVMGLAACGSGSGASSGSNGIGPITFAAGKDTSGYRTQLINTWNKNHPDQKVTFIELSATDQHTPVVQDLQTHSGKYDLIGADVNWTAEFAARKWIQPLNSYNIDTSSIIPSTVQTATYQGKLYAIPFETNAEMLFYRKDLVKTPPTSWDQLIASCTTATSNNMGCYGGQFASYEGLSVNFFEILNSMGGQLVDSSGKVTIDTPVAKQALTFLQNAFKNGTIPKEAITYHEEESRLAFQQGRLMYLNNWPYVWSLAQKAGSNSVVQGKVGVAPLPGFNGKSGVSTLGGLNLAINIASKHKQTAVNFIKYTLDPNNQKQDLLTASNAPVVSSVYDDAQVKQQVPYIQTLRAAIQNAQPRPQLVRYAEISQAIQDAVYPVLQGQKDVNSTLSSLQTKLDQIVAQN